MTMVETRPSAALGMRGEPAFAQAVVTLGARIRTWE